MFGRYLYVPLFFLVMVACSPDSSTSRDDYTVTVADAAVVNDAIAAKRGNVVLVNFWATWCQPCVAEFPDIISLYNRYRDRGFDVITISYDFEDQIESAVIPFLTEHKADFTNLLQSETAVDQEFLRSIDPELTGGLPTTLLFDRNGKRQYLHVGEFDPAELEGRIRELLENE